MFEFLKKKKCDNSQERFERIHKMIEEEILERNKEEVKTPDNKENQAQDKYEEFLPYVDDFIYRRSYALNGYPYYKRRFKEKSTDRGEYVQYQLAEDYIDPAKDFVLPNEIRRLLDDPIRHSECTFVDKLQKHLAENGLKSTDVYNAAQMDRRLFSQILSDRRYTPSRETCLKLILALKLDIYEARDWFARAGYALKPNSLRDTIIECCIRNHYNSISGVNYILSRYDEKPLG